MLTSAELAQMRADIAQLLPDTCYIVTLTNVSDGQGGVTSSRGTAGPYACRLDVIQGREQVTGGAIQPYTSYMLSLPYDTAIVSTNLVNHNGVDYAVKPPNTNQSWIAVKRVELEKI